MILAVAASEDGAAPGVINNELSSGSENAVEEAAGEGESPVTATMEE